jgi:solute carrier family 24 (sodium/potassium/calcium exchanger), member 6
VDGRASVVIDADHNNHDEGSTAPLDSSSTSKHRRVWYIFKRTFHILFPSLQGFGDKTALGALASLLAAPAVLMLTLTLPVVVTPHDMGLAGVEKELPSAPLQHVEEDGRLVEFEEEGVAERALVASAEEAVQEEMHELEFNRWLMAVQCILGPPFCVSIFFGMLLSVIEFR